MRPKRARAARTSSGVRAISGTSTSTPRPRSRAPRRRQVDLGLAAAGHAVQERGGEGALLHGLPEGRQGAGLVGRRLRPAGAAALEQLGGAHVALARQHHDAQLGQALDGRPQVRLLAAQLGQRQRLAGGPEALEHLGLSAAAGHVGGLPQLDHELLPETRRPDVLLDLDPALAHQPPQARRGVAPNRRASVVRRCGPPARAACSGSPASAAPTRRATARLARTPAGGSTAR